MSRSRSLLLTIVQAARLSLPTAAFCGLALSAALIGIAAEPGSSRAATVTAGLVKDINRDGSSSPDWFADVEGTLFFSAADGTHGHELWKSNGAKAGTVMVKDVNPCGSSGPAALTDVGGTLFFSAADGIHGRELWRTSPISPPDPSDTTLNVRKRLQRLIARGGVSPNHACKRVIVTLQKKKNGTFVKIARKHPALDAHSHYRVGFERPAARRCRIITRFPGDDDHGSSSAHSTFRC